MKIRRRNQISVTGRKWTENLAGAVLVPPLTNVGQAWQCSAMARGSRDRGGISVVGFLADSTHNS